MGANRCYVFHGMWNQLLTRVAMESDFGADIGKTGRWCLVCVYHVEHMYLFTSNVSSLRLPPIGVSLGTSPLDYIVHLSKISKPCS
jgi:hypothetical protein